MSAIVEKPVTDFPVLDEPNPRVFLSMPAHHEMPAILTKLLFQLITTPENHIAHVKIDEEPRISVDIKRQRAADEMMANPKFTYFLAIDQDTVFNPRAVEHLLLRKLPVVGAVIYKKGDRNLPAFGTWDPEREIYNTVVPFPYNALLKVDIVGTGFVLIHRSVFEKIPRPWFRRWKPTGVGGAEDIYFCLQCLEHQVPVFVDTSLNLGHMRYEPFTVTRDDYEKSHVWEMLKHLHQIGLVDQFKEALYAKYSDEPDAQKDVDRVLDVITQTAAPLKDVAFRETARRFEKLQYDENVWNAFKEWNRSISKRGFSWEYVYWLIRFLRELRPNRILDLGSGYSSYLFRHITNAQVWTYDHDAAWLKTAEDFCHKWIPKTVDERFIHYDTPDTVKFQGEFDFISIDTGPTDIGRVEWFEKARNACRGAIGLDDCHIYPLLKAAVEYFRHEHHDRILTLQNTAVATNGRFPIIIFPRE